MTDGIGNGERGGTGPVKVASGEVTVQDSTESLTIDADREEHLTVTAHPDTDSTALYRLNPRERDSWGTIYRFYFDHGEWRLTFEEYDGTEVTISWVVWKL